MSAYYVACQLEDSDVNEYFYKITDPKKMFDVNFLLLNNKKVKIKKRGIPRDFIDVSIDKHFDVVVLSGI